MATPNVEVLQGRVDRILSEVNLDERLSVENAIKALWVITGSGYWDTLIIRHSDLFKDLITIQEARTFKTMLLDKSGMDVQFLIAVAELQIFLLRMKGKGKK